MLEWDTHAKVLYELEHAGQLIGIHVGNRVWYSRAQLISVLGQPPNGHGEPGKMERTDKGGNPQRSYFEQLAIPEAA